MRKELLAILIISVFVLSVNGFFIADKLAENSDNKELIQIPLLSKQSISSQSIVSSNIEDDNNVYEETQKNQDAGVSGVEKSKNSAEEEDGYESVVLKTETDDNEKESDENDEKEDTDKDTDKDKDDQEKDNNNQDNENVLPCFDFDQDGVCDVYENLGCVGQFLIDNGEDECNKLILNEYTGCYNLVDVCPDLNPFEQYVYIEDTTDQFLKIDKRLLRKINEIVNNNLDEDVRTVITYENNKKQIKKAILELGGEIEHEFTIINAFSVVMPAKSNLILQLAALQDVNTIELDAESEVLLFDARNAVEAETVWNDYGYNGTGEVIAVFDTGIMWNHTDYRNDDASTCDMFELQNISGEMQGVQIETCDKIVDADNFVWDHPYGGYKNFPFDATGHGTHVAGIALGTSIKSDINGYDTSTFGETLVDGTIGIGPGLLKGIAPEAKLAMYKVCNSFGSCTNSRLLEAMEYYYNYSVNTLGDNTPLMSLSIGSSWDIPTNFMTTGIDALFDQGAIIVAAAGNDGENNTINCPACGKNVIAVAGSKKNISQGIWDSSSRGYLSWTERTDGGNIDGVRVKPNTLAVASDVYSTADDGDYEKRSGTSMAAPAVAGGVALLKQAHPTWDNKMLRSAVTTVGDDLGLPYHYQGPGLFNISKSMNVKAWVWPNDLEFGLINDPMILNYEDNILLNFTSIDASAVDYDVTVVKYASQDPNYNVVTDVSSFTLNPGATQVINATLNMDYNHTERDVFHAGAVIINSSYDTFKIPYIFMKLNDYGNRIPVAVLNDNQLSFNHYGSEPSGCAYFSTTDSFYTNYNGCTDEPTDWPTWDGTGSYDPDNDTLEYKWVGANSISSYDFFWGTPNGSQVKLYVNLTFAASTSVELTVNDGKVDSDPVYATIATTNIDYMKEHEKLWYGGTIVGMSPYSGCGGDAYCAEAYDGDWNTYSSANGLQDSIDLMYRYLDYDMPGLFDATTTFEFRIKWGVDAQSAGEQATLELYAWDATVNYYGETKPKDDLRYTETKTAASAGLNSWETIIDVSAHKLNSIYDYMYLFPRVVSENAVIYDAELILKDGGGSVLTTMRDKGALTGEDSSDYSAEKRIEDRKREGFMKSTSNFGADNVINRNVYRQMKRITEDADAIRICSMTYPVLPEIPGYFMNICERDYEANCKPGSVSETYYISEQFSRASYWDLCTPWIDYPVKAGHDYLVGIVGNSSASSGSWYIYTYSTNTYDHWYGGNKTTESIDEETWIDYGPSSAAAWVSIYGADSDDASESISVYENKSIQLNYSTDYPGAWVEYINEGDAEFDSSGFWQTDIHDSGSYNVRVRITDGTIFEDRIVDVNVLETPENDPPFMDAVSDITITEEDTVNVNVNVVDDNTTLYYYIDDSKFSQPGGVNTSLFTWTTAEGDAGVYPVTVNVTDGEYWDSESFILTVNEKPAPPEPAAEKLKIDGAKINPANPTASQTVECEFPGAANPSKGWYAYLFRFRFFEVLNNGKTKQIGNSVYVDQDGFYDDPSVFLSSKYTNSGKKYKCIVYDTLDNRMASAEFMVQ